MWTVEFSIEFLCWIVPHVHKQKNPLVSPVDSPDAQTQMPLWSEPPQSAFSSLASSSWAQPHPLPQWIPLPWAILPWATRGPRCHHWTRRRGNLSRRALTHTHPPYIRGRVGLWTLNNVSLGSFGRDRRTNEKRYNDRKHLISLCSKQNIQVEPTVRAKAMLRLPACDGSERGRTQWGNPSSSSCEEEYRVTVECNWV